MANASSSSSRQPQRTDRSPESFESLRQRIEAVETLQSYEKLSWYSALRHETLAQTRLHFQNIVAGFTAADEAALVDWPIDNSVPLNRSGEVDQRKASSSGKGKERAIGAESSVDSPTGKERQTPARTNDTGSSKKKRKSTTHG